MKPEDYKEFAEKMGEEVSAQIKKGVDAAEKTLTEKYEELKKGSITKADFDELQQKSLEPVNDLLKKLEEATTSQGTKINTIITEAKQGEQKSLEQFLSEKADEIKAMRDGSGAKGYIEISGKELKAAGITSIGSAIPTPSPYAPGIGGPDLNIFELQRDPNYITSKVNLGRTNQSILAWANELDIQGVPALVNEGALKPLTQHRFEVETSKAKKIAGYVEITDEFDQDLPYFSSTIQRMLQNDVIRAWDDQIQLDVIAAALPFNITGLNGLIQDANFWDALLAMLGQIGFYNFTPNTVAINWLTNVLLKTEKNANGTYLLPSFVEEIQKMMNYANKVAVGYGLVGDLMQYNVDIYKDFYLKIGWINDDLIKNQFAVVGEVRYHSYISDNRKKAICYDNLNTVDGLVNAA